VADSMSDKATLELRLRHEPWWQRAAWEQREPVPVKIVTQGELDRLLERLGPDDWRSSEVLSNLGYVSVWDGEAFCICWTGFSPTGEAPPPIRVPKVFVPLSH
jgi:hypothetical protein